MSIPDENYKWTKMKSKNDLDYEIGVRVSDLAKVGGAEQYESMLAKARAAEPLDGSATERSIVTTVSPPWEVQTNDAWQSTNPSSAVATHLHIDRYMLRPSPAPFYSHRLDVHVTSTGWSGRTFWFIDESGDEYKLYAFWTGEHSVRYYSYKPTIVRIRTLE